MFVDICKDYLKYEKGILYQVFGDIDDIADKIGWNRSKKIMPIACAVVIGVFLILIAVMCILQYLFPS